MIGTTLAHYRITAALGAGGMGEVWRATDEKLGREVAIKVLPAEMAADPERLDRFRREATMLAALDHPGVVGVYSVEESDGLHFLTMQLVEGEPLDRLIPEGGMDVDRILEIGAAVAEALAAAHDKGIVHRDLKPANVMVTKDGRVKVLDFGLAKIAGPQSDEPLHSEMATDLRTREGVVMGTMPYMSPEQISGRAVDRQTDIFSLGVVLYEMAAGSRPFQGQSSVEIASAILRDAPQPLGELRTDISEALARVIGRCLEKKAADRVPSALDLREALITVPDGSPSIQATVAPVSPSTAAADSSAARADEGFWVAVLPFKYTGADADLKALAEGLTEDIVTGLSRFSYLRVVARSSTLRFGSESVDVRAVGQEIGARFVMEGSLRQAGARMRLAVQLVDTNSGAHLWAETYDRSFSAESVFELQDDLVPRIVSTVADMHGVLPRSMSEAVSGKPTDQLTPYEALLHSFGYNERFTPKALAEARTSLERAVREAPDNGDCWAMLSLMYSNEWGHWDNQNPDFFDKALQAARKAVLASPLHSLPHYALAQAHFFRRDFPASRTAAERAVSLNPMDGSTAAFMGLLIAYSGEWERGCALADRALELNPNLPGMYHYTAWHDAYRRKDYRRALELALKLNTPDNFYQHAVLAMCHAQLGEMDAAHRSLEDMLALKPDYAKVARQLHGKWIQPDLVEQLMDGLRKAGLEIADEGQPGEASSGDLSSGAQRTDEGFWVAVLPFKYIGSDSDPASLAEGMTEEIVTGLSRFSYLRVIARGSEANDPRFVIEGSLRKAGTKVRLAVQLVDVTTGAHLWAETYERRFDPEAAFELLDDLVPRIVATVGDAHGILPHTLSELLRDRAPDGLTPYESVLRAFGQGFRRTSEEHATVRACLERAVEEAPRSSDAWALLALTYVDEQTHGYNQRPNSLDRALEAARRAVDEAPSNAMAYNALAWTMFFRKERQAFRTAAEKSIVLNPLNSPTLAGLGALTAYAGDWDGGSALVERAVELNPRHPGWYWFPLFYKSYREGDYRGAVNVALKINLPAFFVTHEALAAAYGQLGDHDAAGKALSEMHRLKPDYAATGRARLEKWFDMDLVEHMMDGLRKAGLELGPAPKSASSSAQVGTLATLDSGAARADEGFWVAVLPFKYAGGDSDLTALAEGLSEDIVTGLSRFSYLRVIARSSTMRYASEGDDVRAVGEELGARYVIEGSIRQAGPTLRISAQLVDTSSGAHLWAETYERSFRTDAIFELQDDLVPRIVSTVADWYGILPHSMSEAVRSKPIDQLTPYEALLRAFGYFERVTPEEHAAARPILERAAEEAPGHAASWAMLSMLYGEEHRFGFNVEPDPLGRSLQAARRAVEAAPSSHVSHLALAQAHYFRKEFDAFRDAAERAVALNPMDGATVEYLGHLLAFAGDWERGCELGERARQLNPHHPPWYWALPFLDAYRKGDYRGARALVPKALMPGQYYSHALFAALYGQLGEREAAGEALREVLALRPDFAEIARDQFGKWYLPQLVEQLIDGLSKAGLEVPSSVRGHRP